MQTRLTLIHFLVAMLAAQTLCADRRHETISLWPEDQRAFFQDGPSWLFGTPDKRRVEDAEDEAARQQVIEELLSDPIPATEVNELREGIARRQASIRNAGWTFLDDRARLLFLRGEPTEREIVDCGWVFEPLEIWRYGTEELVVYPPRLEAPWRLWLPIDGKEAIYTDAMSQYLSAIERRGRGRRWDLKLCPEAKAVDKATGIDGLTVKQDDAPTMAALRRFVGPPQEIATWARDASVTSLDGAPEGLTIEEVRVEFPSRKGQRIVTRVTVTLPADAALGVSDGGTKEHFDIGIEGHLEESSEVFDSFRFRFRPAKGDSPRPIGLVAEQPLRSGHTFVLRLRIEDQVDGGVAWRTVGFKVPGSPVAIDLPEVPEDSIVAVAETVEKQKLIGKDSIILIPPPADVVLGTWRAVAMVTGETIQKVLFSVDDQAQMSRTQAPFSAEVRLSHFPTEQIVRADGLDAKGQVVASDEVVLNRPLGALRVRIVEPEEAVGPRAGPVRVTAEIVIPHERDVEKVDFLLGDEIVASLAKPPWTTEVTVADSPADGISYITVIAELDDGSRAEDVFFFSSTEFREDLDVDLVELYATVQGQGGHLVRDLSRDDFEVKEDGRAVELTRFELVDDLPLVAGIALDLSGSMANSIVEAEEAALDFLRNVVNEGDKCFALGFADRPVMLMPPTDDVDAVAFSLQGLRAYGNTALYDALIHSLYYFAHADGRGVLVLLSDGEDTSSHLGFRDALEYSRRSGVVIYTVALGVRTLDLSLREKLKTLAEETGGRTYFIDNAEELASVYREIQEELRSQYLLAYHSDRGDQDTYRAVEVEVKRRGLTARAARGTY